MSSYHDSTQIPLSGVVWMKFSAKLSMIIVRSSARPKFLKSLLKYKMVSEYNIIGNIIAYIA